MDDRIANNIVVIGLGMTGISVVKYLTTQYPDKTINVLDSRINPPGEAQLPTGVVFHKGGLQNAVILAADLIIVSPGIPLSTPVLQEALACGIEIIGDIELFARAVNAPVLGITGSNGKSTVTTLVGEMAKADQCRVGIGGNIGVPALELLNQSLDLYVLELSSFQLETTYSLSMTAAAFLNFSEDHMDRYTSLNDYLFAKQHIFKQTHLGIWNHDDKQTAPLNSVARNSFGIENGDYCVSEQEGQPYLMAKGDKIMPTSDIGLIGRHNVANCLAAMALADAAGISRTAQCHVMKTYQGLPHRCQKILQQNGIIWINDSKATNLASTIAALNGLQLQGRLHLLVGGDSKGADVSELASVFSPLNLALYCFGQDAHKFMPLAPNAVLVETLEQAMENAYQHAKEGDMILLSPACASLDQFANFMARGDAFVHYAHQLSAREKG